MFHHLQPDTSRRALTVAGDDNLDLDVLDDVALGLRRPERLLRFVRSEGSRALDLVDADVTAQLVSARARALFTTERLHGWRAEPVQVDVRGDVLDEYSLLVVVGRAGAPDRSRSTEVVEPPPVPGGSGMPALRGLYFDEETWDGSDLFLLEGTRLLLVTDKVRGAVEAAGLSGFEFVPADEVVTPDLTRV